MLTRQQYLVVSPVAMEDVRGSDGSGVTEIESIQAYIYFLPCLQKCSRLSFGTEALVPRRARHAGFRSSTPLFFASTDKSLACESAAVCVHPKHLVQRSTPLML